MRRLASGRLIVVSRVYMMWITILTGLLLCPLLALIAAETETTWTSREIVGPYPDGVPGSGYGCDKSCDEGDVHYVIRASLETYPVANSHRYPFFHGDADVKMFTRTFTGDTSVSSPFCQGYDGINAPLGPCLTVNPGQTMTVKVINDMDFGMERLRQHKAELSQYWALALELGQPNLDNLTFFGVAPPRPEDMIVNEMQDLPGWDATFDDVNLHFHGMQIIPHLFYPQGTGNASAEWITIQPASENPVRQCFCYVFSVPPTHPMGTFFYHVHRHGSVAMQVWQGMIGYLQVGSHDTAGSPDYELAQQGITRNEPLVLWEWMIDQTPLNGTNNTFIEGQFISQTTQKIFLTNNGYEPIYQMCVNEVIHFLLVCGQASTGSILYIVGPNETVAPFYVFASDGISYTKAYNKTTIVVGPGQREGLLVSFPSPGTYRLVQTILNDFQNTGEVGSSPAGKVFIAALFNVTTSCVGEPIDLGNLTFTPGMNDDIQSTEVKTEISVNFEVQNQLDRAPVPQFVVDGQLFDYERITHSVTVGVSNAWWLTSNMNYFHPFHIHVNPFQIKSVTAGYLPGVLPDGTTLESAVYGSSLEPSNMWRDTVLIPPYGVVSIWQRFGDGVAFAGKSVFHCHFVDHEDQGMIAAFMIARPSNGTNTTSGADLSSGIFGFMLSVVAFLGLADFSLYPL